MEPTSNIVYYISTIAGLTALTGLYIFGVWLRAYVFPADNTTPVKKLMLGSIPVALLTMGAYAKTSFPTLTIQPQNLPFDAAIMAGYSIVFGMLSREALEKLLRIQPLAPMQNDTHLKDQDAINKDENSRGG